MHVPLGQRATVVPDGRLPRHALSNCRNDAREATRCALARIVLARWVSSALRQWGVRVLLVIGEPHSHAVADAEVGIDGEITTPIALGARTYSGNRSMVPRRS